MKVLSFQTTEVTVKQLSGDTDPQKNGVACPPPASNGKVNQVLRYDAGNCDEITMATNYCKL
jgi:hypothetical protein